MEDRGRAPVQFLPFCVILLSLLGAPSPAKGDDGPLYSYSDDTDLGTIGPHETEVDLPVPLLYYGQRFQKAYILKDGIVSLEQGVRFVDLEWREGTPNLALDRPFIAPFHYDGFMALTNPQAYPGKIYYKLMSRQRNDMSLSETDRQFMLTLDDYLSGATVLLKSGFKSDFVLRVTWENVTSVGDCTEDQLASSGCLSNTFQVLIVANTEYTFAIFNYYKMEIPFTSHQLAGLNGGHGRGWTDVVPCTGRCLKRSKGDRSRIESLVSRVGSDHAGRYILAVHGDTIVRGGCLAKGVKSTMAQLEVYPRQAGMFGGEMLAVSGLCHPAGTKIYCRFGSNDLARSEGVMESTMRGRCPVPLLTTRGQVKLEMSTDNVSWKTETYMTIVLPSRLPRPIDVSGIIEPWYQIDPVDLRIRWRRDLFSSKVAATLDLNLIGYRETSSSETPIITKDLVQLATGVLNTDEQHTVDPNQFVCSGIDCQDFEIALVQLRVADNYVDETTQYQAVTLGPVPIGWYVKQAMTEQYGQNWPAQKCKAWNDKDKQTSDWLQHLLPCPCTLSQALADWGRWQPDLGCNMFTGSVCSYHIGAKHCVRSVHPSPDGSGNQCCYEEDGNLRYAADTYQGSTPDRSHDWGAYPYGRTDRVPSLSHWLHDVVTFYYCCLWVEYKQCSYYMDRRATRDCKHYTPPHSATVYGDPHIITFDNTSYYFGGAGDFWILRSDDLNIQGRFEERENEYLEINAKQLAPTNLTALVMWTTGSDVITIRMAPPGGVVNRKLDVLVGSQRYFFDKSSQMWQDFHQVSVTNSGTTGSLADKQHSNFTVLFVGGAAVQVAERQGLLHAVVILPPNSGKTKGLLGTFDGDGTNDFTDPEGLVVPLDAAEDRIYFDFSSKWNVNKNDSKFHWPNTASSDWPLFGEAKSFAYKQDSQSMKPSENQVQQVCGESASCQRDYYVTGDATVARATRKTAESFQDLHNSQAKVRTCGHLDIPMSVKEPSIYTEGTVVEVIGCRPNNAAVQGSGPVVYTCQTTGDSSSAPMWTPEPDRNLCPHVIEESEVQTASDVGLIVGIVVPVVVVLLIVVVVAIVCVRRRGQKDKEGSEARPVPTKRSNVPTDVVIDPGTDEALLKRKERERGAVAMSDVKERSGSEEAV